MSIEIMRLVKVRAKLEPAFKVQLLKSPLQFLAGYDLTEEEKCQIIVPNFSWLVENKLAALSYPESDDAFSVLWHMGIRALLNLSEMPLPVDVLNKVGIQTEHIPIVGFEAPSIQQIKRAITMIDVCLDRNMPIGVHCVAGLGRTGTVLACYLVKREMSARKAIDTIRAWRPGSIEGPEQENVIYEYEHFLAIYIYE